MIVLDPSYDTHLLKIIPRYYAEDAIIMELFNEEKRTTLTYTLEPFNQDGYMYLEFEQEFINNTNYQIKISKDNDIVYRGKLFITNQANTTQEYKISKDVFTYE